MQPIILLGAAVVAVALVGTGFLDVPVNNIVLWVQELGWGEEDLQAPISHAYIDLELKKVLNDNNTEETGDDFFNNLIFACSFHSDQSIRGSDTGTDRLGDLNLAPALIICKLTNEEDVAIAEGRIVLDGEGDPNCPQRDEAINGYDASDNIRIDICQNAYPNSNEVQEVTDIKIVVEGALNRVPQNSED